MRSVPEHVLSELAGRFGYAPETLAKLGGGREDSDGITYRTATTPAYVLKIIAANPQNPHAKMNAQARASFFSFLGQRGVEVVAPEKNAGGNLLETMEADGALFLAYTYKLLEGEHPSPGNWTEEMLRAWGRTIGMGHHLTKAYPLWEGIDLGNGQPPLLHWRSELHGFRMWAKDEDIKARWTEMEKRLEALEQSHDTMGFVHNDPHMENILYKDGKIKVLDFDVACCHFFASDLAIAIQGVLFTRGGGMDRPVEKPDVIRWFTDNLLSGYARENTLTYEMTSNLNLFIDYRRLLLFTVMQDWLNTKPEAKKSWLRMISAPPAIIT